MRWAALWATLTFALPATAETGVTLEECIRIALSRSPTIAKQEAIHQEWEARLRQVQSVFYPKISGMTYVAPIFKVSGSALERDVQRDFSKWGPYWHLEALLAQPIYAFGRVKAGKKAARNRALVEKARIRETRNVVTLEVRKLYYTHLMARSILPTLETVGKIVNEAHEKATELYATKDGSVTKADLMKLEYAKTEVEKGRLRATGGAALALSALKHTMGLPQNTPLVLRARRLPKAKKKPSLDLPKLIQLSAEQRPEWAQLAHGRKAAIALEDAERLADAPVLFVAGRISFDWAPNREDSDNPYHYDQYNDLSGGIAVGLTFDMDPALSVAKAEEAKAIQARVAALRRFAATGIPLQVRKAHDEVLERWRLVKLSKRGVKATRKWMTFSGVAYQSGTGEARDVLEGVGAYVMAKKDYYDHLLGYHVARAELELAVGR